MIRHARLRSPATIPALPVAMVQLPFHAALVPAIGTAVLCETDLRAANGAAITLSAIAAAANPEHHLATATNPLPESDLAWNRHAARRRPWTTDPIDGRILPAFGLAACSRLPRGTGARHVGGN